MADIAIESNAHSEAGLALETLKAALRPALTILALAALLAVASFVSERGMDDSNWVAVTQGEDLSREWAWQPSAKTFDGMYREQH